MSITLSSNAPAALREYYSILAGGPEAYAEGAPLRPLLSPHLDFTGSLAGHQPDATEGFLWGVAGFIGTVQRMDLIRDAHDEAGSAVLYRATMPGGDVTFAEFFTFVEGRIDTLHLHYDGPDYLAKGGQ